MTRIGLRTGLVSEAYSVAEVAYQGGLTKEALKVAREKLRELRDGAKSRHEYRAIQGILDDLGSAETYHARISKKAD